MNMKPSILYFLTVLLLAACIKTEPMIPTPTLLPPTETPIPSKTPLPTITPEGDIGSTWLRPKDGMAMVYVPKGAFTMGSNLGESDEQPVHDVYLDAFWIDQTEVTFTMYASFAPSRSGQYPVQNVTCEEASAYCSWVGSRLPTEAEWEKSARSPDERTYPWGNQNPAGDLVNFADVKSHLSWGDVNVNDGYENVAPVGSYPAGASMYGALDMAGNLAEWVKDWYDETYYNTSPLDNPTGPVEGFFRALRGGSWYGNADSVRTADRSWYIPEGGTDYVGFRCAQNTVMP